MRQEKPENEKYLVQQKLENSTILHTLFNFNFFFNLKSEKGFIAFLKTSQFTPGKEHILTLLSENGQNQAGFS